MNHIENITALRNLEPTTNNERVLLLGYYSSNGTGGGLFYYDNLDNTSKDNAGTIIVNKSGKRWKRHGVEDSNTIPASWFGCIGDGVTDNASASQAAITYCLALGYSLTYGAGIFLHKNNVIKAGSFECPSIYGAGSARTTSAKGTILKFETGMYFKIKGGSGTICNAVIDSITFCGSDRTVDTPFIIADQGGVTVRNCRFENARWGAVLHNESKGAFTEFNIFNNCTFATSCYGHLQYKRTAGNDSFHGSGLWDCTLQQQYTASGESYDGPQIQIGENCLVYNAPMQFKTFSSNSGDEPIIDHNGISNSNTYGRITVEKSSKTVELVGTKPLFILGSVQTLTENLKTTNAWFCSRFQTNRDGSINYDRLPFSSIGTLPAGGGSVVSLVNGQSAFVTVQVSAANYKYKYMLLVSRNDDGYLGTVSTIAKLFELNNGYGQPLFYFTEGKLFVSNEKYPNSTVSYKVRVNLTDTRTQFLML
jgi:hypothetical protein